MSAPVVGMLEILEKRAAEQRDQLLCRLSDAQAEGRSEMNLAELQAERDLHSLEARCDELRDEATRAGDITALTRAINPPKETRAMTTTTALAHLDDRDLQYRQGDTRTSYFRDLMRTKLNIDDNGESRRRLGVHAQQVAEHPAFREVRDLSRDGGDGGYFSPPAWLIDQYVKLARPGRAFANLVQHQMLPGSTDSINIPKVLSGTAVGIQTADNTSVVDVDLTDTFINAPVRTIAGQQGVAIQLIDQSPIQFDQVVFGDLIAAHAAQTDVQCLYGTGASGQVLGLSNTPGIGSVAVSDVTVEGLYSAVANAIQQIHTTRFLPPDVILMHPRRWGWALSQLDSEHRPLFVPNAQGPMNAQGILENVDSQQIVGQMLGLPIVTDPNISVTAGSGSGGGTEDVVYVLRASDIVLYESGIKSRVLPEVKAQNLTVLFQIYSYLAFTCERYVQSIVEISGLTTPTF